MKQKILYITMLLSLLLLGACGDQQKEVKPLTNQTVNSVYYKENELKIEVEGLVYTFDYEQDAVAFRGKVAKVIVTDNKVLLQMPFDQKEEFLATFEENKRLFLGENS